LARRNSIKTFECAHAVTTLQETVKSFKNRMNERREVKNTDLK